MRRTPVAPLLALLLPAAVAGAQSDRAVADFLKHRQKALAEAGQRHLRLGSWARKAGLIPQATAQFLRAVEVSEGHNPGARTVLRIMRGLGDAFWRGERKNPSKALLADFERRAAANEAKTRKAHATLAKRAQKAKLFDLGQEHWLEVMELGGELEVDDRGAFRLDGHRIPEELADWLQQQTARVNGEQPVFEAAGKNAPRLDGVTEHRSIRLSVRTDLPGDAAERLHALGEALWPPLEARLDGSPTRLLRLFVFAKNADYAAYLDARDLGRHKQAPGLADYGTFQTLVCAEGLDDDALHSLVLHELSHLFFFGTAPATMPDWYAEGFAESFGGQGTFTWDGVTLTTGGAMRRDRIDDLKAQPMPFADMLTADAATLWASKPDLGHRFYVQCWALQRFLRDPECPWHARFVHFESKCRGQVLGAPERRALGNPGPANEVFEQLFRQDLGALEAAFLEWLRQL